MDIHNSIMYIHKSVMDIHKKGLIMDINSCWFMDINNSIMDIHNWIVDIHNWFIHKSIMDIHNCGVLSPLALHTQMCNDMDIDTTDPSGSNILADAVTPQPLD